MPMYEYETIPSRNGDKVLRFELRQGMMDPPLCKHPETGVPVRRVITGGLEIPRGTSKPKPSGPPQPCSDSCSCCP